MINSTIQPGYRQTSMVSGYGYPSTNVTRASYATGPYSTTGYGSTTYSRSPSYSNAYSSSPSYQTYYGGASSPMINTNTYSSYPSVTSNSSYIRPTACMPATSYISSPTVVSSAPQTVYHQHQHVHSHRVLQQQSAPAYPCNTCPPMQQAPVMPCVAPIVCKKK